MGLNPVHQGLQANYLICVLTDQYLLFADGVSKINNSLEELFSKVEIKMLWPIFKGN